MSPHLARPPQLMRHLDVDALAVLGDEEAETGEEDGLQNNHQYRDLRAVDWDTVAQAIRAEKQLFSRFAAAADLEAEAERYTEECFEAIAPEEDWWGLDVGVIGATLALSALGAVTFSSCNAGAFGGRHVEKFPLVMLFLPRAIAQEVLAIATQANVGLDMAHDGTVQLYGRADHDLHRFAETALARHRRDARGL